MARSGHHCRGGLALAGAALALALGAASAQAATLSCGQTITQSTKLSNDLTGCTGDGIDIGADGITLNLAGHTLTSGNRTGYGINFNGHRDVRVLNGNVDGFQRDVFIDGNDNLVTHVRASQADFGFFIDGTGAGGDRNTLSHDSAIGNDRGIYEHGGANSTVTDAIADGNRNYNIAFSEGSANTVTHSSAINAAKADNIDFTGGDGIVVYKEVGDNVTHNTATGNGANGANLYISSGITVTHNTVSKNSVAGVYLVAVQGSQITHNQIDKNDYQGIYDAFGSGNTLSKNTALSASM